ncbi:methyltransferase domain-containing protein [Kitasatospora sp. NBC_00070]|uniref:class I SAM-dependent methyltransferase n=1 Tax=Kitasatospora sp. NBC_00070 TaxID=2975962 RepID=UPI0032450738
MPDAPTRSDLGRLLPLRARHLHRLRLGRTLDVGCGVGRHLRNCGPGSVGVDHDARAVLTARAHGLAAYTTAEFEADPELGRPGAFDSLLVSHVLAHLDPAGGRHLLGRYLPAVRPGGRVVLITPQPAGYRADPTHVRFVDLPALRELAELAGLRIGRGYSHPLPEPAGRLVKYNEYVLVGIVP